MKDELAKSIEFEKNALKAEQDQLKNGVEVKEIKTPEMVKQIKGGKNGKHNKTNERS